MVIKAFVTQKGEIYLFAIKEGWSNVIIVTVKETLRDGHVHNYSFVSKDAIFNLESSEIEKYINDQAKVHNAHEIGVYFPSHIFLPYFEEGNNYRAVIHEKYELHPTEINHNIDGVHNAKFWAENEKQLKR